LISAGRLNQHYLVRLIHDHALSHGVLDYMFDGIQPVQTDLVRYGRLLLHAVKNGPFSMRCRWAESRGSNDAAQFISANRLKPLGSGRSIYRRNDGTSLPFGHSKGSGYADFKVDRRCNGLVAINETSIF